jgi:hypothetical protein
MCQRGTTHIASLKFKKYISCLIAFQKTLQILKQEWQKNQPLDKANSRQKLGLAWFGEIERKLAKLSVPTFTSRSSS